MSTIDYSSLSDKVLNALKTAGNAIMKVYLDPQLSNTIEYKSDQSPLTIADKLSNEILIKELSAISSFPILSEESKMIDYDIRKNWNRFWLVDPLDGTKEFINRNGEFTVNVALIENNVPVFGAIGVPAREVYYLSYEGKSWKITNGEKRELKVNNKDVKRVAVRSKSHPSPEEEIVLKKYSVDNFVSVGSSLKFCLVAEGNADIYYRHGPTMEWDIAAGHAIVRSAGGEVYQGNSSENVFTYNKENLLNGSFLCLGFKDEQ